MDLVDLYFSSNKKEEEERDIVDQVFADKKVAVDRGEDDPLKSIFMRQKTSEWERGKAERMASPEADAGRHFEFPPETYEGEGEVRGKVGKRKEHDTDPWIDPIYAATGPAGFVRKAGMKAAGKAVAGSLAAEPVIGGVQEYLDEAMGDLPGYIQAPAQIATGVLVGGGLTKGARKGKRAVVDLVDVVVSRKQPKPDVVDDVVKTMFKDRFTAPEGKIPASRRGPVVKPEDAVPEETAFGPIDTFSDQVTESAHRSVRDQIYHLAPAEPTVVKKTPKRPMVEDDVEVRQGGIEQSQNLKAMRGTETPERTDELQPVFDEVEMPTQRDMEEAGQLFGTALPEDEAYAEYTKKVLDEVIRYAYENDPVRVAAKQIAKGGGVNSKAMKALGLGRDEIFELNSRYPGLVSKKGGMSLDEAVTEYGFRDAEEFRQKLLETPTKEKLLKDNGITLHSNPLPEIFNAFKNTYGKYVGTPVWDKLVQERLPALLDRVPGGKPVTRAFWKGWRGADFDNPEAYNKLLKDMRTNQGVGAEYALMLGRRLQSVPEADQLKLGDYIRGERDALPKNLQGLGDEVQDAFFHLGKLSVQEGLLKEEVFFKNVGKYLPRLYASKEYDALARKFNITQKTGMSMDRWKKRKDIPKEVREQMGEILTPGYPVAKGITQITHDIEFQKFFRGVQRNPKWSNHVEVLPTGDGTHGVWKNGQFVQEFDKLGQARKFVSDNGLDSVPEGWVKMDGKRFGELNGAYVHPEIAADLKWLRPESQGNMSRAWNKSLGMWKFGKVVLSPKTHMRNMFSNSILAHLGGMPMTMQPVYLKKAASQMRGKGEYWQMAKQTGLLQNTFIQAELRDVFRSVNTELGGASANSMAEHFGVLGKAFTGMQKGAKKAADLYQAEESFFKMAKFIHNIERRGMNAQDAAADAEKWLFNYNDLTRFQAKYKQSPLGAPFATFTFKALPRVMEAAVKTPWRFALPMSGIYYLNYLADEKFDVREEQGEAKRELTPDWIKGPLNWPRVPVLDDHGREHYLNLTYVLPWGDFWEGGGAFGIPGGLMPFSQPFVRESIEQISNYDWFWKDEIVRSEDMAGREGIDKAATEYKQRFRHAYNTMVPTIFLDIEKAVQAVRGKPDYRGRERDAAVTFADILTGVKMYPVDYADELRKRLVQDNPKIGSDARKIQRYIKNAYTQREAMKQKGKPYKRFDEEIEDRMLQLMGLAKEAKNWAEIGEEAGVK